MLVIADPERAVSRVRQDNNAAQCIVFCAEGLGETAPQRLQNALAGDDRTVSVPTVLLLDESQKGWKEQANAAEHRIVLTMPITMKELRATLATLLDRLPAK